MNEQTTTEATAAAPEGQAPEEQRTSMMLAHLLGILGVIVALIYWLINKDKNDQPFVQDQAREVLNFQINIAIVYFIGAVFIVLGLRVGATLYTIAWLGSLVFSILGALKAKGGTAYRYPGFVLRLIK